MTTMHTFGQEECESPCIIVQGSVAFMARCAIYFVTRQSISSWLAGSNYHILATSSIAAWISWTMMLQWCRAWAILFIVPSNTIYLLTLPTRYWLQQRLPVSIVLRLRALYCRWCGRKCSSRAVCFICHLDVGLMNLRYIKWRSLWCAVWFERRGVKVSKWLNFNFFWLLTRHCCIFEK